jgi:hypothetical protein
MITAMNTLVLILVLIATAAVLRLVYLTIVGKDGYGDRRHQAPRSHHQSPSDPRIPTRLA